MSPLQIAGFAVGLLAGMTKLMVLIAEIAADTDLVPTEGGGCLTIVTVIGWVAFFTARTRDQIFARLEAHTDRRINQLHAAIGQAIDDAVEETESRLSSEWHLANAADRQAPTQRKPHLVH